MISVGRGQGNNICAPAYRSTQAFSKQAFWKQTATANLLLFPHRYLYKYSPYEMPHMKGLALDISRRNNFNLCKYCLKLKWFGHLNFIIGTTALKLSIDYKALTRKNIWS